MSVIVIICLSTVDITIIIIIQNDDKEFTCLLWDTTSKWGKSEIIYPSLHCHHQNDSCIKMDSDESLFNVSVESDGQSYKTVSTNHHLLEEKGEPKRYRTEVLPLTSLTPYRSAKPAH